MELLVVVGFIIMCKRFWGLARAPAASPAVECKPVGAGAAVWVEARNLHRVAKGNHCNRITFAQLLIRIR